MLISKSPDKKRRADVAKAMLIAVAIAIASMFLHFVVAVKQYANPIDVGGLPTFNVTSDNLHDGVWDEKIGAKHGNISPQLSWDKVDGAAMYGILMIDYDGSNWLHWFAKIDNTQVKEGAYKDKNDGYIGPYPPSGTHNYTVYVFALKGDTYNIDIQLDKGGADIDDIANQLDNGITTDYRNVLSVGIIEGSYSAD